MRTSFIAAAAAFALAAQASAAPANAPYALEAVHADFLGQLEAAALAPEEVGAAAGTAAAAWSSHIAAEERIVLPLLGLAETVSAGKVVPDAERTQVGLAELQAELPRLLDGRIEVVSALAELFAAADADGQPDISRLAERMVWHEMGDAEVLYPAAVLFGSTVRAILTGVDGAVAPSDAEALH